MPMALPMLLSGLFTTMVPVFGKDLHFGGVDVDAVAENGFRPQNSVVLQALHRTAAVVLQAVVHVVHALGNVDVDSRCVPLLAATMRSKVLSERVKRAWPPNMAASMGSFRCSHSVMKSAFS